MFKVVEQTQPSDEAGASEESPTHPSRSRSSLDFGQVCAHLSNEHTFLAWIWTGDEGPRKVMDSTFADDQPHTVLVDIHFAGVNGRVQGFGLGFEALASLSRCTVQFSGIQIENIGMVKS